jgi:hypothetical protein
VLSNDWVIRYDTRYFQVARQSQQAPARSTVLVRENASGAIEIRYRERLMPWTEIAAPAKPTPAAKRPPLSTAPHRPARPSADHPWRRHSRHRPRACAEPRRTAVKSLWKLTQPWTPRTRPPLLGKPPERVFHELPQAVSLVQKGTFLFR